MSTTIPDKDAPQFRRFILDNVPVAMITMDADLKISCFNRRAEALTGYSAAEALGRPCHEILNSSLCDATCPLQTVHEMGESATGIEAELVNRRGEHVPVRIGTAAIEDQQGDFIGYLEVIEDISREKALLRERDNFLFMVAHDMKSPLIAMLGLLDRLHAKHDKMDAARMETYFKTILDSGKQLESRIREFLEYSRQATHNIALEKADIDLTALLDQLIARHEARAEEKKIILLAEHAFSGRIQADGKQLQRVFENLLDNAIKFIQEKGQIVISTKRDARGVIVEIEDNGPGISPEELPYIFDAFHKGLESKGHGLGLAGAKAIVQQHGGRIEVKTRLGHGSRFSVFLPFN